MGDKSPGIWSKRFTNANCLLTFCHIGTKGAFYCLQNTPQSVFSRGSAPDPTGELNNDALAYPLVGWEETPLPIPHSAPIHLRRSPYVPHNSSQISARRFWRLQPLSPPIGVGEMPSGGPKGVWRSIESFHSKVRTDLCFLGDTE